MSSVCQAGFLHFCFVLGIIYGDRCDRKNTKSNLFIQVRPIFLVVELSNTVTL